jgi:DNA-binding response OmpR family regulator
MKLLIIDDDNEMCEMLSSRLSNETYVLDQEWEGDKGSFLARTNSYDLTLLDNSLPKKNGLEVCRAIRDDMVGFKKDMKNGHPNVIWDLIKKQKRSKAK